MWYACPNHPKYQNVPLYLESRWGLAYHSAMPGPPGRHSQPLQDLQSLVLKENKNVEFYVKKSSKISTQ